MLQNDLKFATIIRHVDEALGVLSPAIESVAKAITEVIQAFKFMGKEHIKQIMLETVKRFMSQIEIIEKDYWVVWTLGQLFLIPQLKSHLFEIKFNSI